MAITIIVLVLLSFASWLMIGAADEADRAGHAQKKMADEHNAGMHKIINPECKICMKICFDEMAAKTAREIEEIGKIR